MMLGDIYNKFKDKFHINLAEFMGFKYIRNDRGAREFMYDPDSYINIKYPVPRKYGASTMGLNIYWDCDMNNKIVLQHELSHIEDFKKLGFIPHIIIYGICSKAFGYWDNPFEVKARAAERNEK